MQVVVLNVLLARTLIGWVVALVQALGTTTTEQQQFMAAVAGRNQPPGYAPSTPANPGLSVGMTCRTVATSGTVRNGGRCLWMARAMAPGRTGERRALSGLELNGVRPERVAQSEISPCRLIPAEGILVVVRLC